MIMESVVSVTSLTPAKTAPLFVRGNYQQEHTSVRVCLHSRQYSRQHSELNDSPTKSAVSFKLAKTAASSFSPRSPKVTKTQAVISPAKHAPVDDDQLPPLLSMAIEGLPPMKQSKYVLEAENLLKQYVERYQIISFDAYCRVGLSSASFAHPGVLSVDRLVAISIQYALGFLLDDLFIDDPDEFLLDQYGIDRSARDSPQKMRQYLDHLDAVFGQQNLPATLMETILWESGRDILQLSNPEWFNMYVERVIEHHHISVASHANIAACIQDLESYTAMRAGNIGGNFVQLIIEFANNTYIPSGLRSDPYMQKVTSYTTIHTGFVNDIYSYHKESSLEGNPRNLITVLMEREGKSFVQAMHAAIGMANEYARTIMDLESEARKSGLQNHLQDIKALIAGNVYFGCMDERYRQADSVFPEQRDLSPMRL